MEKHIGEPNMKKTFEITPNRRDPNTVSVRLAKGCTATYELQANGHVALASIDSMSPETQREIDRDPGAFLGAGHLKNARANVESYFAERRADAA